MPGALDQVLQSLARPSGDYRELRDFLPWCYLVLDESARIEEANPAAVRLMGFARADLLGVSLHAYLSDDGVGLLLDMLARCKESQASEACHLELTSRDGRARHVELHARAAAGGDRVHYRVAMLDVTDIRRANLALRRTADEMRDLYQNAPCGYHSLDADGVIVQINATELRWLGYEREEIVHRRKLTELLPPRCCAEFEAAFASLKARGRVRDLRLDFRRKDGSVFTTLLSATALRDSRGQFLESRASVFDITRRKLAEEEASRYAQRLKGMSRRAAEVQENERRALAQELHDRVGQNLTALNINLNILKSALAATVSPVVAARLDDSLKLVDKTVESMRDVMTELRPAVLDDYGLAAMLRGYAEEFSRRTDLSVRVIGSDPSPRLSPAVERTIFRIVQEALNNVAKHASARRATLALEPRAGSFELCVEDDGCGFDAAAEQQNNHRGWGLMIMRERAESAGASLQVDSAAGRGTRVVIRAGLSP
jgi:PAS domain S-box-containing protein